MKTDQIVAMLSRQNLSLAVEGDELVVRGEKQRLDAALIELLQQNKKELLEFLRDGANASRLGWPDGVPENRIPADCTAITPDMLPLVALSAAEIAGVVAAVPGGAANVQDVYPLAPLQEGILFHHLLSGEGDPYLSCETYWFDDRDRLDAYVAALQSVIERHDALRTAILWEGLSEPVQVVLRSAPLIVEEVTDAPAGGDRAEQLAARFSPRHYRLDLRKAPLLRAVVAREAHGERWAMVLLEHHIWGDNTSVHLLRREVEAHLLGRAGELPAPTPFRNFISQARFGVSRAEHELFFREMLEDVDEPTAPFGLVDVQRDGSRIREASDVIGAALGARLRSAARAIGVSTASLWHVAWARVLARVSGRDDVVFGTVLFGRMQGEGADQALGMFTNTLPVRLRIGEHGVRESVEQVQSLLAQLLRHEHAPLTLAQACSAVPASTPLFSSLLNYRHGSAHSAQVADAWKGVSLLGGEERTNYPIGVSVNDTGDELSLSVKSDASVDPARLCAYLQMALAGVADALERDPARALASVEVVPERERTQVLYEWNATEASYAGARCVHELFEQQAARSPESAAVEFDGERLSYAELNARANRLARHLRGLGVQARTHVGVLMERSLEFAVGVLGVLKAGGVYVPLDPAYPEERLAFMLADAAPPVVLTHERVAADRAELLRHSPVRVVDVVADADVWSAESASNLPAAADASDLAYVIYTSGSTGAPKGVMVSHEQLCSRLLGAQLDLGFGAGDVLTNLASPAFDIALFELLMPLVSGGCSLLLGGAQVKDIEQLRTRTQHATVFHAVPTLMEAWLDSLDAGEYGSLHTVLVGGEAVPERLLGKLTARFPQARVFEFYGPTEAVIISTRYRADGAALTGAMHCIGRPFANTRAYILDARLQPAPVGVAGELYIGGAQVARGYLNRADLTAERFIASPFVDGDRLYKTGDLARYLPDGNIEFLGRNDFQVKIRGFRIELGEIEARLWSYPGVREAAVVALEDRTGEKRLVAYYTALDASGALGAEELRSHVAATLPEYMIPAAYVQLDVLPLTAHGKLDRRALPAPDDNAYASRAYEAPVGDIELSLAAVWRELLAVERVGRNDNFFELGGHSLLVVAALERLRQVGLHVDAAAFFGSATLGALASEVQEESLQVAIPPNAIPADCTAITPDMLPLVTLSAAEIAAIVAAVPGGAANVQDIYPLAPLQEGVLFHHLLGGEGDPYLSRTVYRFDSRERLEAYLRALESVMARHDVLRTAVVWEGLSEPVQVVLRRAPLTVEEVTVDPSAGDVGEQLATRFNPRHFRLDVRQAPIMRAYIARDGAGDGWSMVLLKHHLLGDHTAMELMQHDVEAHLLGEADDLPAPVPFRNFIAQARLGVSREEHELFFREMLADVDEPTAPFGLVDVRRDGSTTRQAFEVVDAAVAERLRNAARAIGVSTASLCHVAWARVLARVSGRDDVVFGTLMFGRMQGEGSDRALGMFMNTLPVRLRIDGRGVRESVGQTQLLLAQLLRHEHAPLALAQRCSAVPGSLPLFTSLLNYRHDDSSIAGEAWEGITVDEAEERTNYPIGMSVNDHGGGALSLSVKSDVSVDPARLCGYMQTALAGVVDALEREPARALASVEVVPEHERRQVLVEWNATEHASIGARCVHELFEEQAARSPESVAVEFHGERLSYAELNARANRLARHLQAQGVQARTHVGVLMERSLEFAVGVLAVLKAGGVYVPLDPAYPHERLAFMLADAAPPVVLTHERVAADCAELLQQSPVRVVDVVADANVWSAQAGSDLPGAAAPSDLAYVIYTSGSTGSPKGVMVSHEQLCSRLLGAQLDLGFGAGDVVTNLASPAFDIALFELLMPLVSGGCSLLLGSGQVKDIEQLRVRTQHATVFHAVPTLMEAWLDSLDASEYGSLHTVLVGGEAVPERLLAKLTARFPQARVFEFYGPTEAVIISTRYRADGAALQGVAHCIGRPFANTRAYILDARLEPVPIGVGGELYIGGAQVARGYLNRADLTAERFIASPFVNSDRLYKTGDLARYLPDGNIEFLGRNDFQVKIRGFRIELGEIEARLWSYPGVREAAVVALEDRTGEKRLVAYYTALDASGAIGAEELRGHVAATLPEYMIPAAYVQLDVLPLTAHGKLDRRALPAPDDSAYVSRAYEAPVGETELTLAAVWRELLGVERVGRNDNFFELGGHSLLVVAALERLRQVGLHVDAAAFFASATLSALASAVRDESMDVAIPPNAIAADCTAITPEMLPLVQLSAAEIAGIVAAVPGGAANVQDIYPLAPLQEGILFHHLLGGEGDPYLSRTGYRFESRERLNAYLQALEAVIARHDVLRTAVAWEGLPEPVQVVLRRAPLAVEEVSVDPSAGDVVEQLAARFNPRHFRLDVRQAPIMRAYVARDGAGDGWSMVLLKHHLLGDHTAMDLMQHEVETHLLGRADELPVSVPFRNFIAQARLGISREEHEQFFREMLADVDEPTAPFGLVDVHRDGSTTNQTYEVVDASLAERLRNVARAVGVSTASICHVAWARVLARVSGRDDVVFGTLLFGRMQGEGSDRALGMFMNTLPMRLRIDERGVRQSVEQTQLLLAQLLRHEHAPLALAQRCSAVPGSTPLFSSLLNYRHGASKNAASSDVEQAWRGIDVQSGEERTNYPIGMSVNDHGDELSLSVKSDSSVDPNRLCGYMQTALAGMVDALEREPARALSSVEVVPERERLQVLVEWNATEAAYAGARCVHELFEEQAVRSAESAAVEFDGERLSYGELNARANRLARHLQALGVQAQMRVGVLMERSLEFVVGVLGVLKAGGVYVPLDPAYPHERLAFMLADAAPPVVLTHERVAGDLAELLRQSPVRVVDVVADSGDWSAQVASDLQGAAAPSDLAYVIYTSGSTGAPKGVMVSHEQLCSRLLGAQLDLGFGPTDVVTSLASPAFDIALFELLMPLVSGGCSLLLGSAQVKDIEQLRARTQHATVFHAVPTLMEAWLDSLAASEYGSLHTVLVGGEAVPERLLRKLTARFPHARVFEFYGPTEAVIISTRYRADGGALTGVAHCIGRPFANTRTYILDARLAPAPIGVGGELYIGGAQVARGYLNRADLTAERFVASPFVDGDRLYKTGDLARYLPDGNIEFLGRNDFQVKIRGFRIELGEIEARLSSYPGVREVAVVALEDRSGEKRLVAYYTTSDAPAAEELRNHVAATLPEYMIPAAYVRLDALPLTTHGKLDRRALPAPDDSAYVSRAYEAPAGEIELTLAAVWRELLNVERVGRNDNFFELGGHSLLVVAALERLRQVGLHVDAAAFFASATLSALASAVRDESMEVAIPPNTIPADCTTITPAMLPLVQLSAPEIAGIVAAVPGGAANVQDVYPLAPLQEGILFHHILGGDGDPYLGRSTYRFESRERLDAYLEALQAVIARHDVLRTAVLWEGLPEPVQVVLRRAPMTVEELSVDPSAGDVSEQLAARFNPRHFRLDVRQAPIMRAYVARDGQRDGVSDGWAMVLLKHHLLGDHTAMEVMQHEVETHLLGAADELPAPVPFRNFIAQARLGISREEHEQFFREMLSDVDEPTAPFGLVDVRRDGSTTNQTYEVIDASLAERLRNVARSVGVSTASICHVAWARVLARVSGRDDVVFGTLLFGRMQGEGSARALGMFMNTLPVRLRIGERGVRQSVEHTQLLLAQLLRHEHAPLTLAQACSAVPASTPLFSSLLNYRHGKPRKKDEDEAWKGFAARGGEERTNYPIGMSVNDHGDELSLSVKSDASVDPDRLCGYMQTALAGVVDALENEPARALASVEVVPQRERTQVLYEWNATERPYPAADRCVHELFEEQAARASKSVALEFDGERMTYGELNTRANRLARHLQALGVQAQTRVGVLMERSLEFVVGVLAVLKAGGVYVPLDPAYPQERLAFMLADAAPPVVLTHERVSADRAELLQQSPARAVDVVADAGNWSQQPGSNLPGAAAASDLAYVIYTSGSTGAPKGVMVSHEQLCSRLLGVQRDLGVGAGDVLTNLASPAFDIALFELLMPLVNGGCSLLLGGAQVKDIEQLRARTQHATVFHAVPTLMEAWLDSLGAGEYGSLHTVLVGGEAVPERLLGKLTARFPRARVFEFYGPTEAVIISTRYRADVPGPAGVAHCIGRPFANTRIYIVDARLQPAPIGVGGELYIGGAQVARGYLNRADLTAERFIASPFVRGDRLYKTGDLARYLPDGNIEFLGRNDFQVKIRGFRIELGEIEARLWSYPGVREAAVVALEDRTGEKRLVAYYTASDALGAEELRSHVAATLPEYMIPAAYVQLDALPLTAHGKLDRRALPAPDDGAYASRAYEAPVGDVELTLAAVWRELLKVERVGRNDNFFELGGHSLLVVAALERLRQVGLHVDAADFFASGTLSALASAARDESMEVAIPPNEIAADCTTITPEMLPLVALSAAEIDTVVTTVPGGAANVQDIYPLAPLQGGILFHHILGGEGDPYLGRSTFRFESRERLDAYLEALQAVIARHDVLRTAVLWERLPEPVQVVLRRAPLTVEEVIADPSAGDVSEQLAARFNPRHFRLDVRQAPIMRAYIARDRDGDGWSMALLKHHLLGDHTAMELMQHEIEAHLLGRIDELPAPAPFRNFIAQARLGGSREEHEQFFREMLADVDEPTAPFGLVDVRRDGSTTRQTYEVIDASLSERLRNAARSVGVSTASICHVAWARVLARVSGRDDVVFGTLLFGRMQGEGSDRALGMFMNTLPVRMRIDERGVRESIEQTQLLLAQLLRHEHAPLTLAQACSAVPASTPLFSSLLNYRHGKPRKKDGDEAWKGFAARGGEERTNYPIGMSVNDHGDELSLSVKSDASVDPDRLCGYMQTALAQLVDALENEPARTLSSVEVVPERERQQVLVEWNATEAAYAGARCVHELFEEQAARSPESVALEFDGERLSYGELNARANRLARHVQALGVQGRTRVGVLMERSLEFVVGVLAVLKAGGVYVPLDPAYPQERLAYVVADSAPVLLLTHDAAGAEVREMFARSGVPMIDVVADAGRWSEEPASNLDAAAASDLAYVIYTSGSTGAPKGVMVSHEQLCSRLLGVQLDLGLGAGDVLTNLASPAFDIALFELLMPLVSGGCSLLLGSAQVKDIEQLRARTQHATVFHAVPTLMEAWLDSLAATEYGSLHTVLVGGEAVPERLLRKLTARFPQARVFEFYGPTEAVIISTRYRADGAALEGVAHCIGRPFANTRTYILDARLAPAPIGVGGELYIGGAQVARGYLNRADLTAERFVASPFVDGDRLYKTGDLARYLPDGNIEFLGRNDFQVKIRGFRIELGEIEARLASYPGVREAVVLALEDRTGEKRLVAYHTPLSASGAPSAIGAEELRSHVAAALPDYMIPAAYVQLDTLPLTVHGKVDRRALPAPDDSAYASRAYEAPVGDVELTLAAVWRELLKVERVGRNDNFFELGGHSLLVVAALERLRQVGLHVDAADFFASGTLGALASAARDESLEVAIPPNAIPADCTAITPEMLPLVQLSAAEIAGIVAAVPGGAANVQDIYPLAPLQEGILFHHMLRGDGDPYLGRSTYRFESRERLDAYLHALESIMARHDVLRTAVVWEGLPEPVQVVLRRAPLTVEEVSVDPAAGDVAEQLAARFNPRHFRLDVRQAPIMRAYIARDGAGGGWSMVMLKHHLLGDHTTMELMQQEVEAYLLGRADELPAPVPFRNFIAQARLGVSSEEHEQFFREMLADVDEPTAPFGLVDVQGDGTSTRRTYQIIDSALAERLRSAARSIGVSAASICHVAWARVLASVSGRDDVVFGSVLFGRMQGGHGADRALGMFMNTLPVRLRIGERGVRESIEEAQLLLAQLLRHEHAPLALAQRCSSVPASTPLFSSLLNYRHGKPRKKKDGDDAWKGIAARGGEERTNYPVTISVNDHGDELSLSAQTDASVDPDRLCGSMQTVLAQLVEALESEPARPLARIEVLSEREREHVLVEWNATERPYPDDVCVHELFEAQVRTSPGATAVEDEHAQLRYAELNERANRLARHLRARGVGPDVRVGVCMERSVEMVVALLAVFKAGGAYVPLDPGYPAERLSFVVEDSAPALVLTHSAVAAEVRETIARSGAPAIDVVADAARWAGESGDNLAADGLLPTHLAYVIYTSGSTGRPKGAMNEHRAVVNRLLWVQEAYGLGADDAVLQKTPFSFDVSVWELFWPLLCGARLVMARPEGHKDPEYLARIVHEQRITTMHFVPSMLGYFLEQDAAAQCASLKTVMCSGEALTPSLVERFYERLPLVQLSNLYGPTEAAIDVTEWRCSRENVPANIPIGRPIANTRTYILDNRREPVPVGVAGELYIGGVQVGRGYLNRPDLTAERFIANPFVAGDRLYKTGDLARFLPDGDIEYLGRNDFQVKIRGFRIELGEIEARLATYPGVREAVVTASDDALGEKRLVAYYTAPEEIGAQALRDHLLAALPDYMVPAAYVPLESLPITPSGKLDRKALPAPGGAGYASRAYEAPAGAIETALAAIWSELLKVERVGRNDNFFELGGHSLLAMRVLSRVRQAFALEARLSDVFTHPTLAGFAHALESSTRSALPPLLPVDRSEPIPLSFSQERLWFSVQLDPAASRAYHIPFGLPMKGALDVSALRRALNEIVARHESLRTTFVEVDGEAVQRIAAPDAGFQLVEHDLRGAPDAAAELQQISKRERQTPFDLQAGPLIRGRLITSEDDEHLLAVTAHHIISDGWSTGVFMRELNALYAAYRAGRPSPLPPLAIQFADYAVWQRRWLAENVLQDQVAYWQRTLAGVPALLELPSDRPRPAVSDHRGASLGFELDAETTARVKALTRRNGSTLFITLLTAWGALLARLSGQDDVVVGTPVANRLRPELEPLIGYFVNTLALRLDYSGSRTVSEMLNHVKERVIAGQDNQDIPFDQVVEVVNPPRSLSYNALFQTMFVWNNAERGQRTLEGLEAQTPTVAPASAASSQVDLTLELAERGDRIAGTVVYATALFDRETVERYCGYLQRILGAMVEDES